MGALLERLFTRDFMPHGHCYFWEPAIVWLHVISDALIVLAYYSIPLALVYFVRKRNDLAFNWMFVLFATFILACGTTHLMEIWNVWNGDYLAAGLVKGITALASIPTAILLWPLIPRALKLPSPAALEQVNRSLEHEIGERKRAEGELRTLNINLENRVGEATAQLQLEGRLKDDFLATLSHELRTPLNAILGWTQLMKTKNKPENFEKGIEIIERNTRSQVQLIEDLLDMSRITSGKIRLDVKRIDLPNIIRASVSSLEPTAEAKSITIQQILDPSASSLMGDAARLQQIVWNLLSNAIKFTPRGGKIQILSTKVNSHIQFSVSDTGVGIRPEFLPYVFDRFRQDDASTTRKFGGLGLGLSIVKHLVELHGGTVKASSLGEGKGTTVSVEFPVMIMHDEKFEMSPPQHYAPSREVSLDNSPLLKDLTVLVVDDEPDSREIMKRILEERQARVVTAGSVDNALDILAREPINLVISDIGMPDKDGYDLVKRIRASDDIKIKRLPAIALTAFARSEDRTRAALAGFNSHLAKPAEASELIAVVASLAHIAERHSI